MKIIPNKLRVGYKGNGQHFVTYYDPLTGQVRLSDSYNNWMGDSTDYKDFDNNLMSWLKVVDWGGGVENSWSFDTRKTYITIQDSRGFTFEITVPNFLKVLNFASKNSSSNCLKIDYYIGWDGPQVHVVPLIDSEWSNALSLHNNKILPISTITELKNNKWFRIGDSNQFMYFLDRFKPIKYQLRHNYPKFDIKYPNLGGKGEGSESLKEIQSSAYPPQKYPEMDEILNVGVEEKYTQYFITTDPDSPSRIKAFKSIPSNLYPVSPEEVPIEARNSILGMYSQLLFLRFPIKRVKYTHLSYQEFSEMVKKEEFFLSKNFGGGIFRFYKGCLALPFRWVRDAGDKFENSYFPLKLNYKDEREIYQILNPYKVSFIIENEEEHEVTETDYALYSIQP